MARCSILRPFRTRLEFGHLGRFFQADMGGTPVLRALRPEGPWELGPGRRRCALARPGLASAIAELPGRDVGLAESGFSLGRLHPQRQPSQGATP